MIKTGKMPANYLHVLKDIVKAREEFKKGKLAKHEVEDARKNAYLLINSLIEYTQRCDLAAVEKGKMQIKYKEAGKEQIAELLLTDKLTFLIKDMKVSKVGDRIDPSTREELEKAINEQKGKTKLQISSKVFNTLRKELGNFEIVI